MKLLRKFVKNCKATLLLKKKYYRITSCVGMLSVFMGIGLFFILAQPVASVLGVDAASKLPESSAHSGSIMVSAIVLMALCIYAGVLLVAGTFSFIMLKTGNFTKQEAISYTLYSDYPEYWFEEAQ
jgi:hypothetical protein